MTAPAAKPEAILDAALELFVERGFHGTAVPLVAERAGVGAGTIYRYFESKEALVNALYQKWKSTIASQVMADFPVEKSMREQFRSIWQRMAAFAQQHPRAYAFLELHHHASYLDDKSRAIENQIIDFATIMIQKAQADQVLKPIDPALLMHLVHGAFIGMVRASSEGRIKLTRDNIVAAEQCCWEAMRL